MTQPSMLALDVPAPPRAGQYRCLMSDPPWLERGSGQCKRGADRHYPLMKTEAICQLPVREWMHQDSHAYVWVTNNFMRDGFRVLDAWGYRFVTVITWFKGDRVDELQMGIGQYFRGCTEHVLFGVRGNCEYRTREDGKRAQGMTGFAARRTAHSVKPEEMRRMVELVSHGPYLEMFARRPVPGWDLWGNQAPVEAS